VKKRTVLAVLGYLTIVTGCGNPDVGLGPRRILLSDPALSLECQFTSQQCNIIQSAIDFLKNSSSSECQSVGDMSQYIFDMPTGQGGFKPAETPSSWPPYAPLGVEMAPGSSYSGWVATSGYVQVHPYFWEAGYTTAAAGGRVAHEVGGHMTGNDSPEHNTGLGPLLQTLCQQSEN
jgi:hypothetical protein